MGLALKNGWQPILVSSGAVGLGMGSLGLKLRPKKISSVQKCAAGGDSKVVSLLQYLNLHLADPLTIDELAARFYISKYHMMRRFRQETGYSVHGYLTEKRLLLARQLLGQGCTPAEAAAQAGYQDYSTFSRAYKKQFGHGPSADTKGKQQDLQITTQEF